MMISRVNRLIFYLEIRLGSSAQAKVEFSSKIVVYIFILFLAGVFILVIYLCHKKKKEKPLFMCMKLYNTTVPTFLGNKSGNCRFVAYRKAAEAILVSKFVKQ